jgi:hypothetical protein
LQCPHLEQVFPKLVAAGYEKTSDATGLPPTLGAYNCIAWAAHDTHHMFWWPDQDSYWPFWIERDETIPCFVRTFCWLGYRECGNSRLEFGYEKIALYAIGEKPKHMARQLRDGTWTSKCGGAEDITHFTLDAVECYGPYGYGTPVLYMRRLIPISWIVRIVQQAAHRAESFWE